MTYGELSYRAKKLYTKGKITISEYLEMTKPLDREIEQEPFDIETYCKEHFVVMVDKDVWEKAEKALKQEPKTGRWEYVQYDYNPKLGNWHCSECRCIVVECVDKEEKGGIPLYKYCPQCGAKMQEAEIEG